jgi:hypothetical protein
MSAQAFMDEIEWERDLQMDPEPVKEKKAKKVKAKKRRDSGSDPDDLDFEDAFVGDTPSNLFSCLLRT